MADREAVVVTPIVAIAADAASQLAGTPPPGSDGWASTVADGVGSATGVKVETTTAAVVVDAAAEAEAEAGAADEAPAVVAPPAKFGIGDVAEMVVVAALYDKIEVSLAEATIVARAVVLANNMDADLEELGVNEVKLKEFVGMCVDRLTAKDTISMKTLKMQAHYLKNHRSHAEIKRSRRAVTELVADSEHPQKMLFTEGDDACPPKDMVSGMKAIGMAAAVRTMLGDSQKAAKEKKGSFEVLDTTGVTTAKIAQMVPDAVDMQELEKEWASGPIGLKKEYLQRVAAIVGGVVLAAPEMLMQLDRHVEAAIETAASIVEALCDEQEMAWNSVSKLSAALFTQPDQRIGSLFAKLREVTLSTKLNAMQHLRYVDELQTEMVESIDRLGEARKLLHDSEAQLAGATRDLIRANGRHYTALFDVHTTVVTEAEFHASIRMVSKDLHLYGKERLAFEKDKEAQLAECHAPQWAMRPAWTWKMALRVVVRAAYFRLGIKIHGNSWFHAAKMALPPLKPTVAAIAMKALVNSSRKVTSRSLDGNAMAVKGQGQAEVDLEAVDPIDPAWINPDGGTPLQALPMKLVLPGMAVGPLPYEKLELAVGGFCITAASRQHSIVLPVDKRLGCILYDDQVFGFSTRDAAQDFLKNPDGFKKRLTERARTQPEYLELFEMHDYFPEVTGLRFKQIKLDGKMDDVMNAMGSELADRNADVSEWGCRAIMNFGKASDKHCIQLLDNDAIDCVIGAFKKHPDHFMTNKLALQAILEISRIDEVAVQLRASQCTKLTIEGMLRHIASEELQILGCNILTRMIDAGVEELEQADGVRGLLVSIRAYPNSAELITRAFEVIKTCAHYSETMRQSFVNLGGLINLYAAVRNHRTDMACLRWLLEALERLCITVEIRTKVSSDNVVPMVVGVMRETGSSPLVQQACCRVLARLAQSPEICADIILQGGIQLTVAAMTTHIADIDVQLYACWALVELAGGQADSEELARIEGRPVPEDNAGADDDSTASPAIKEGKSAKKPSKWKGLSKVAEGADNVMLAKNASSLTDDIGSLASESAAASAAAGDTSPDFQIAVATRRMSSLKNVFSSWVVVTEKAADCKVVVEAVLKGMKKHVEVADVQRYGCKALENLAVRSLHQRVIVAKANAVQIMLKGMKAHADDVEVQSFGCHALAVMSGDDLVMHEHITQMSGAVYMLDQLKIHSTSADFTANVCRLLANLSLHDTVRAYLIKKLALPAIIRGIKEHSTDTDVNHFGFSALSNFANDTKLRPMIAKEITALVHKTLHTLHSDPDVQISGVTLLERISFNANHQVLVGERSVKLMVKVLDAHKDDMQAVVVAMTALSSLTRNAKNQDAAMAANAAELVVERLKNYMTDARICHFAVGVLSNLVFKSTKYKAVISKTGAVQTVIDTMGTHLFEAAVQLAGVSFFRNFTASSEVHRTEVGRKGGILAIVDGLREHQTSEDLYFQGCGALNNLCRDSLPLNKAAAKAARASEVVGAVAESFDPTSPTRQAIMELIARLVK